MRMGERLLPHCRSGSEPALEGTGPDGERGEIKETVPERCP